MRINRFYKEQRLDTLLSRQKDDKKRKTGNESIEQDDEIQRLMRGGVENNVLFIVIATPVEEVGRDHDFDWAVIDASSVQSIVQTAGRVNRHRQESIRQPNIIIPQFNHRHCKNAQQQKSKLPAFIYPGYEGYAKNEKYATHDLIELLPWQNGQLVIDARLRFDTEHCLFAKYDETEIQAFCQRYFYDEGEMLFSSSDVTSSLMTEQLYQKFTPLRDKQFQALYRLKPDSILEEKLVIEKYETSFDSVSKYKNNDSDWKDFSGDFAAPIMHPAKPQAWLYLSPHQMLEQCEHYAVDSNKGCQISLTVYGDSQTQETCVYDEGFGVAGHASS